MLLVVVMLMQTALPVRQATAAGSEAGGGNKTAAADRKAVPDEPIRKIVTGKSRYNPGETAEFELHFNESTDWSGKLVLEFYLVNQLAGKVEKNITVLRQADSNLTVKWTPPAVDFRGYLVKAYIKGNPDDYKTAAVDVSSDWTHFPRYGYTSEFPNETPEQSEAKIKELSQEYYINGYQFYDWMWRHDVSVYSKTDENGKPLRDENGHFIDAEIHADTSYDDLLGRKLYPAAVKQQVAAAQLYGSAAMAYQMNYAAREQYEDFGVKREWGLYQKHAEFPHPDPLKYQYGFFFDWVPSALYLQDPGNPEWQAYITREFNRSVNAFGFDGIHLDQWGASDNDFLYDYEGNERYYARSYDELINATKDALTVNNPSKNDVTFNMVGGNAGYSEVTGPNVKTDFDYSEIWSDKDNYRDLKGVIDDTRAKNGNKAMVIAGYMNYKQATGDTYRAEDLDNVARTVEFVSRINRVPGWVGDFGKKDEDQIIWTVDAPAEGLYDLTLKYGHDNGGGHPIGRLTVNGSPLEGTIDFEERTGWGNPVAEKTVRAALRQGANEIRLQLNTNDLWLNVDSLVVSGMDEAREYEAEYAELISCKVDKYGHVYYFETDGDYVTFQVRAEQDGEYPIVFRYGVASNGVSRDVYVNQELVHTGLNFPATGNWEFFKHTAPITIPLKAGSNSVTLKLNGVSDTGLKLDYAEVLTMRYEAEKASYGWQPSKTAVIERHEGSETESYVHNIRQAPDSVTFDLTATEAGEKTVVLQYASDNAAAGELLVNDVKVQDVDFPNTGGWAVDGKWAWRTVRLPVREGVNTVRLALTTNGQFLNLDGILTESGIIRVDSAVLTGGVTSAGNGDTAKTDNFNGESGKSASFTVSVPETGTYKLGLWYRTGTDNTSASLQIDDGASYVVGLDNNGWYGQDWWGLSETEAALTAGEHTVTVTLGSESTYVNLHALSYSMKLEAEGASVRTNGVVKSAEWLDDFGQSGDAVVWTGARDTAGDEEAVFIYRSNETLEYEVRLNGVSQSLTFEASDGSWMEKRLKMPLQAGVNTLQLMPIRELETSIQLLVLQIGGERVTAESMSRKGAASIGSDGGDPGYADRFMQKGDYIRMAWGAVASSGVYPLTVTYRNQGTDTVRSVYLNGKKAGTLALPATGETWREATIPLYVSATHPSNSLTIKMETDSTQTGIAIDKAVIDGTTVEAETADIGWEPVIVKTGGVQPSLGKTDNHGHAGQTVVFQFETLRSAKEILINYRSGNNPVFDIIVDGVLAADDVVFGATPGGWDGGMAEKGVKVDLAPGPHTVEMTMVSEGQYINLDSMVAAGIETEVEDAILLPEDHGISVSTGSVTGFGDENDFLTFSVELPKAQNVSLGWRYRNRGESGQTAVRGVYVNGTKQTDLAFPHTGDDWETVITEEFALRSGTNTIMLRLEDRDDQGIELDYLDVGSRRLHAEKADYRPSMVLYKDLLLNFGHVGDEITFPISNDQPGETSLIFSYANDGVASTKTLYIDGEPVTGADGTPVKIYFSPTGNGDAFNEDVYYIVPYLSAGEHTVTLKHEATDKGSITLKSMTIGFFDEPSVRLMDAALAAMGATHIELGTSESIDEGPNMLAHEYYPNRSKKMKNSLKSAMKEYYKFFTAYENLLYDSVEDRQKAVTVTDAQGQAVATSHDGAADALMTIVRSNDANGGFEQYEVIHLVNLIGNDGNWRNAAAEPKTMTNLKVTYPLGLTSKEVPRLSVYAASPDREGGLLKALDYEWDGTNLEITLPSLNYWEMIVIDKDTKKGKTNGK
ncbi:glycoside hydrolase family 66 protein [Cohnella algarum]|uniref:glycoside hydrolase family 66 protein n=1 Tax=Cohnella algarum TaxID=2044859 RepID=UPI0019689C90|nr:glycoside hydrolase family 66 protein [Cohnella algarum]MBN2982325.1 hypothetical protein [Cohnella algarum]